MTTSEVMLWCRLNEYFDNWCIGACEIIHSCISYSDLFLLGPDQLITFENFCKSDAFQAVVMWHQLITFENFSTSADFQYVVMWPAPEQHS